MRAVVLLIFCLSCQNPNAADQSTLVQAEDIQLSPPQYQLDSIFFQERARLEIQSGIANTDILYTDDGSGVTPQSNLLTEPLYFETDFTVHVEAFHELLQPSEVISVAGRKYKDPEILQMRSSHQPKAPYNQGSWPLLFDGEKGNFNFRESKWMGFQEDSLEFFIQLKSERLIEQITLSTLYDPGAWIIDPRRLEIRINGELKGTFLVNPLDEEEQAQFQFWDVQIVPTSGRDIQVRIMGNKLPEWHPGKGETGWLFMDEILIR